MKYWLCVNPGYLHAYDQGLSAGCISKSDGDNPGDSLEGSIWEEITEDEYNYYLNNDWGF